MQRGAARAAALSVMRFLAARMQMGSVDEYWLVPRAHIRAADSDPNDIPPGSTCLGFSVTIIKGRVLRGMWFYQRLETRKSKIWYHAMRTAIERTIALRQLVLSGEFKTLAQQLQAGTSLSKALGSLVNNPQEMLPLAWVDGGPSYNSQVEIAKKKAGFTSVREYAHLYEGGTLLTALPQHLRFSLWQPSPFVTNSAPLSAQPAATSSAMTNNASAVKAPSAPGPAVAICASATPVVDKRALAKAERAKNWEAKAKQKPKTWQKDSQSSPPTHTDSVASVEAS